MGQWVGPVVYDLERMAERARRLGYQAEVDCRPVGGPALWAGHPVLHIGPDKAAVVALEGGTDLAWVYSRLSDAVIAEIEGWTGTERLLRAVSVWGFAAMMRANGQREGERRVCHVEAVFKTAKGIQALAEGDVTRAAVCFTQAASWAAEAASKGVPK